VNSSHWSKPEPQALALVGARIVPSSCKVQHETELLVALILTLSN